MISTAQKVLPRNQFARSVSVLAGGTAVGQAAVVLASPLLTRLYSPEDFGLLGVYAALLLIVGVVASLRYQLAIPLPKDDSAAADVVVLSLLVVLGMTLIASLAVLFFRQPIADTFNIPALGRYLWLLPVGLLLSGIYQVFNYWAIRTKAFPAIARTKLVQSMSMIGIQLGGFTLGPIALLLGQIAGQAAGSASLAALAIRNRWALFRSVRILGLRKAAVRYRRFPIYSTWGGLFKTAGTQLPPLIFAAAFSPAAAGLYILADRVMALPMKLMGSAIANVFFSSAAERRTRDDLGPLAAQIYDKLVLMSVAPTLLVTLFAPELFSIVFGTEWKQSGMLAQWMAPWVFLTFLTSPLRPLFPVLESQREETLIQTGTLLTQLLALTIGVVYNDFYLSVILFSLSGAAWLFVYLLWLFRIARAPLEAILRSSMSAILWGVALVLPLLSYCWARPEGEFFAGVFSVCALMIFLHHIYIIKKAY